MKKTLYICYQWWLNQSGQKGELPASAPLREHLADLALDEVGTWGPRFFLSGDLSTSWEGQDYEGYWRVAIDKIPEMKPAPDHVLKILVEIPFQYWQITGGELSEVPEELYEQLSGLASDKIGVMLSEGYTFGELSNDIKLTDDPENELCFRGVWKID